KQSNDVTRLQALVDKKKVVVTEAAIRDALHLDDAEGVDCLPNEEIFTALARMGVETSLFEGMLVVREPEEQGDAKEQGNDDNAAEEPVTAVDDGRMIDELDKDEGAELMNEKEEKEIEEIQDITVEVVTTTKLITKVVAAVSETVSATAVVPAAVTETVSAAAVVPTAAPVKVDVPFTKRRRGVVIRDPDEESSAKTPTETKSKDKGKGIMVEEPKPIKKKQQIELDKAYARKLQEELNQDIDWEVAMDHVKQKAKENPYVQRYQVMKKRPQTEAQARRNMMVYLKNTAGFRLDYFKGMSYDDIPKRRRLNEEAEDVEELKQHLEIVPDEDDDVYTEATLIARKVPVVDYQIIHFNNKPHYKIIRADETHQLYVSFITLLKNFDREDLESLPDGQDQVWMNQRSVHGHAKVKSWKLLESCGVHIVALTTTQLIMLVERRYPLSRFTLDQMLNTVRLRVEEQSEMSLELIRLTRQQLQEGRAAEKNVAA
nr:hypothetical protein [Tanacetum cinerariifolium]